MFKKLKRAYNDFTKSYALQSVGMKKRKLKKEDINKSVKNDNSSKMS